MGKTIKSNNYASLFMLIFILVSCDTNGVFDAYHSMDNDSWSKNDTIVFPFNPTDTITKHNLFINIRNNNKYPFSNLFLVTQLNFPDGQKIIDTLEYDMTDPSGKFLGEGFSTIKENKLYYKENIRFPMNGNYTLAIFQAMRKSDEVTGIKNLEGVTDVGFRIEKTE